MNSMFCTITYGKTDINYELLMMDRKSLEIAVHPDKSIVVKAPKETPLDAIEERVKKHVRWIKRQLTYFNQFDPKTPERTYVGGESHLYLGKQYRLKIHPSDEDQVSLKQGFFHIECKNQTSEHIKQLLDEWYKEHANNYFTRVFEECWAAFKYENSKKPKMRLQKLEKRWGSLSKSGQLLLNTSLIKAPKQCIEYVIWLITTMAQTFTNCLIKSYLIGLSGSIN